MGRSEPLDRLINALLLVDLFLLRSCPSPNFLQIYLRHHDVCSQELSPNGRPHSPGPCR